MHRALDSTSLVLIVAVGTDTFFVTVFAVGVSGLIRRWNIRVFNSAEGCSRCCCVLVPDLLILEQLFSFLLLSFLGLAGYEYLLVVWWFEG